MVYGACLRVVKNPGIAEEVAQESFLELMKGPGGVQSVGGWLHTVATRRALDRVKADMQRFVSADRHYGCGSPIGGIACLVDTRDAADREDRVPRVH